MTDRNVTTQATARERIEPSTAFVECRITGDADSAHAAHDIADDRVNTIREGLADELSSSPTVELTDLSIKETSEVFGYEGDAQFRAERRVMVGCGPDTVKRIVEIVIDGGGTVVEVRFSIDEAARERLEDRALKLALDRAREKAALLAEAEELELSTVESMATQGGSGEFGSRLLDDALAGTTESNLESHAMIVEQSVEATFALSDR